MRAIAPADESWPGCGQIEGVEQTSATPRVAAWKCTCGLSWAISRVNEHLRRACLAELASERAIRDATTLRPQQPLPDLLRR